MTILPSNSYPRAPGVLSDSASAHVMFRWNQIARMTPVAGNAPISNQELASRQRARVALVALQIIATGNDLLSEDGLHLLRNLAESEDERTMDPDALARSIISRETARLNYRFRL